MIATDPKVPHFSGARAEGADVMTLGTHKLMGGPIGGLVLTNDEEMAKKMLALTHPAFIQTRDQNKYAAAAWSLSELAHFGPQYAKQVQVNSHALAEALDKRGFKVVGREKGYTKTHQVIVNVRDLGPRATKQGSTSRTYSSPRRCSGTIRQMAGAD